MNIKVIHIDGDMEDMGIQVGEVIDDYLQEKRDAVSMRPFQFSDPLTQFFSGLADVADMRKETVGSIILAATQEETGKVEVYGGKVLAARYKFTREDELLVCFGDLAGQDVFLMSQHPHPPGSLLGVCSSGLAWARTIPKQMRPADYEVVQIPEIPLSEWGGRVGILRLSSNFTIALPFEHEMVKKQVAYRHKPVPTPMAAARASFEDAYSAVDLLVLVDTETLEVTLVRGTGEEKTYDLRADF
jgi:hypothetical protein